MLHREYKPFGENSTKYYFNYNSGLSGNVEVGRVDSTGTLYSIYVPGDVLIDFIGEYVSSELVGKIESMSGKEFFARFLGE